MARPLLVPLLLLATVAHADDEGLSGKRKLIVETKSGLWIGSKHTAVVDDTLRFKSDSTRVAVADIAHAWRSRPAVKRRALIGAATGAVGGAFLEIALGSDCPDCKLKAGDVLASAGINAASEALTNAVFGLFYGGWKEVVPGTGHSEPYPVWGGGAAAIWAHALASPMDEGFGVRLASWAFRSRTLSTGVEVGTLPGSSFDYDYTVPDTLAARIGFSSIQGRDRVREVYASSQLRWRAIAGNVRPSWTAGLGSYTTRTAAMSVERDSTGAIVRAHEGSHTETGLGINAGFGASFLSAPLHPAVDARFHWRITEDSRTWVTLGISADWR